MSNIHTYVKTRLGEPVVPVELSDETIDLCYKSAEDCFDSLANFSEKDFKAWWVQEYTLALCLESLSMIRTKMAEILIAGGSIKLSDHLSHSLSKQQSLLNILLVD